MTGKAPSRRLNQASHPLLYEVNTRVLLGELSAKAGKAISLAAIPDALLDEWADLGFDAVWFMGIWTTGPLGREIARSHKGLMSEFRAILPDVKPDDIVGSPYAVQSYEVAAEFGGNAALKTLRQRLARRKISLVLDFVCNHTARDHRWITEHPDFYVNGEPGDEAKDPERYFRTSTSLGERVLAFGRDPSFPGWTDTAQLNHANEATRRALIQSMKRVAGMCDGVRCDMAMLVLGDVFQRTWGERARPRDGKIAEGEFWKVAIESVKSVYPDFIFLAEAYWNLEWRLQQLGFDYTYDKVLYDRLLREGASSVREHLRADLNYQVHTARFIENHDEQRAAKAFATGSWHFAAATIAAASPGMAFFHEGELEGWTVRVPVQLARRPHEPVSDTTRAFYRRLLSCLKQPAFKKGNWQLLTARAAWHENLSWQNYLIFCWQEKECGARLVVVNYAPHSGQCYVDIPLTCIEGSPIEFRDLMGDAFYVRDRASLSSKGMYFDLPGYGIHVFDIAALAPRPRKRANSGS